MQQTMDGALQSSSPPNIASDGVGSVTLEGPTGETELGPDLKTNRDRLVSLLASMGRVVVAFSGGVDSTVVAKAAHLACAGRAIAITAHSPSLASGELEEAVLLAGLIGIPHRVIETQEFTQSQYQENSPTRCYFCKTELYSQIRSLDTMASFDVIVNGANLDDKGDWRPGMQAAREHGVRSPLQECDLKKADVRELALHWGLPTWDKPASPCLSSRIAYGVEVTLERVRRVDAAELFLRGLLGIRELRVRLENNELARIELPTSVLDQYLKPEIRTAISTHLRELGFRYITLDLEGFRSGSMNAALPLVQLA